MSEVLGKQMVVDNRGNAGGTICTRAVARSATDGFTLGLGYSGTLAIGRTPYPSAGYVPRKDFAPPIGLIGNAPTPATHGRMSNGQLRGLAVTSAKRTNLAPNLPTVTQGE